MRSTIAASAWLMMRPPRSMSLDDVIAKGLAGRGLALQHPAELAAFGLLAQVGQEHLRHGAEHADMHGGDGADIDRVQARAGGTASSSWTLGDVGELARQAVDRLDDHHIEGAAAGLRQHLLIAGPVVCWRPRSPGR